MSRSTLVCLAVVLLFAAARPGSAQILQVDLVVEMPSRAGARAKFRVPIEQGPATVSGKLRNLSGGETVRVDLVFDYRLPRGSIALDELIERIELAVLDSTGEVFGAPVTLETNLIHLNPNRARLFYRATLYTPGEEGGYDLRLQVFGNYE